MRCIVPRMDTNACPRCGGRLFANGTCGCGWPKAKARELRLRLPATLAVGKTCSVPGCSWPVAAKDLCWRHYRQLRKQVSADRGRGLGCYRGRSRKVIQFLAAQKKEERQSRKQRHR